MKKNIGELIRQIRKENKLTQKKFGDKFYVTEKTISNYENGSRMPDIEFIENVCRTFKVPLDYFFVEREESSPHALSVVRKYGKLALFDSSQGIYLTPFKYDTILISTLGKHIGMNYEDGFGVTKSVIINNFGETKELDGLLFGHRGGFSIDNTIVALDVKAHTLCVADSNGKILINGFTGPFGKLGVCPFVDLEESFSTIFGKYDEKTKTYTLVSSKGKIINATMSKLGILDYEAEELYKQKNILEYVKNYGISIIQFIPNKMFIKIETYYNILMGLFEFFSSYANVLDQFKIKQELSNCFKILNYVINEMNPNMSSEDYNYINSFPFEDKVNEFIVNRVMKNILLKDFEVFIKNLFPNINM